MIGKISGLMNEAGKKLKTLDKQLEELRKTQPKAEELIALRKEREAVSKKIDSF